MLLFKSLVSVKKAVIIAFKMLYLCLYYVIVCPIKLLIACIK